MGSYRRYSVTLHCEGQMDNLINFMYAIESSPKLLTIEHCQIAPRAEGSIVAKCGMSVARIVMPR